MTTISEELHNRIISYCENNPITIDFDHRDCLSDDQICRVLENPSEGIWDLENDLDDHNFETKHYHEVYFLENDIADEFHDDLIDYFEDDSGQLKEYLVENYIQYVISGMNVKGLIANTGNITCFIEVHSNYDCTNSFDTMEDSYYLQQVYKRVKTGVRKKDFMLEHSGGAYGGSLFCFAFKVDLDGLIKLKQELKESKYIKIPKGTQFGFFSSFQGASSSFEQTTYRNFKLPVKETGPDFNPNYDHIDLVADCEQSYSMRDVFGDTSFVYDQDIKLIKGQ